MDQFHFYFVIGAIQLKKKFQIPIFSSKKQLEIFWSSKLTLRGRIWEELIATLHYSVSKYNL